MSQPYGGAPPPLPALLAGAVLRSVPRGLLRPVLAGAMTVVQRRHPDAFGRLDALGDADFLIDPVDLPLYLVLRLKAGVPRLSVVRHQADAAPPRAIIRGPLPVLVELLEGRVDGDAVFFSRDLAVEGDMEAVVALRNAIDNAGIDLAEDLLSPLGPFRRPARRALRAARVLFARARRDTEIVRDAVVAPVAARCDAQAVRLGELEAALAALSGRISDAKGRRGRGAGPQGAKP